MRVLVHVHTFNEAGFEGKGVLPTSARAGLARAVFLFHFR